MRGKWIKMFFLFIGRMIIAIGVVMLINIAWNGMCLLGIPSIDNLQKVSISYPEVSNETKEITDTEQIELSLKLTSVLNYSIFKKANSSDEPKITITYYLSNGKTRTISASDNTVWWKGKAYTIKQKGVFVNATKGIFFI